MSAIDKIIKFFLREKKEVPVPTVRLESWNSMNETMTERINQPDLLEIIFRYLDPASVKAASLVSR